MTLDEGDWRAIVRKGGELGHNVEFGKRRKWLDQAARLFESIRRIRMIAVFNERRAMSLRRAARYPLLRPKSIGPPREDPGSFEPHIIRIPKG
jgi:hypothetical protein